MEKPTKISLFIFTVFMLISFSYTLTHSVLAQEPAKKPATQKQAVKTPVKKSTLKTQGAALDFELQDIRQDIITLSSYKNKQPVLLFFWTTWCPFCQRELRILNDRYAGLVEDGLEVLAVNVGETPDKVENFVKSYYLAYRVPLDKDTAVAKSYGVLGVPTYVLVDKKGYIVFQDNYFPQGEYKELIAK